MYLANRKQIVPNEFVVSNMCLQTMYVCSWEVSYYYVTNVFSDFKFALKTAIDSLYMYIVQCNLDLVTLLVSEKTVTKSNDFM